MAEPTEVLDGGVRRLTEVSRALTYARSLDDVLDLTVDCAVDLLDGEKAVLMMNDDDGLLQIRAHRGIDENAAGRFRIPLDESIVSRLKSLLGPDAETRFLGVPLVVRGSVMGLLAVRRPGGARVAERDEWLLSALADQAAVALEGARHEELQDRLEALQEQQSLKDHALRVMSHDLRSPLNAIQGYIEVLASGAMGPVNEAQARALRRIRAVGRHLASLVESVLAEARLSGGKVSLHPREVDVADLLNEAAAVALPAADDAGVALSVEAPAELRATLDPDRVRQVVIQLLENAAKYCPAGCSVVVSGDAVDLGGRPGVEIRVADDGPGIPPERQDQVFEPYRSFPGEAGGPGGFGLGLSIVRSIVGRMGGEVGLESEPGRGATFRVVIPARPRPAEPEAG